MSGHLHIALKNFKEDRKLLNKDEDFKTTQKFSIVVVDWIFPFFLSREIFPSQFSPS